MPDDMDAVSDSKLEDTVPLKKPEMTANQIMMWRSRAERANRAHREKIEEKWKTAKKRYNSELYEFKKTKDNYSHQTFNFLFKDVEEFNASIYYKNPTIDLTCRNTKDPIKVRNIENLEQDVNDDIKDNRTLKGLIRSVLVDENLASLGAVMIDYDYRTQEGENIIGQDENGQPIHEKLELANRVRVSKILPTNLIYPQHQCYYNYQESPYLGYVDIVSIECLKNDPTLNPEEVSKLKGKVYSDLLDVDKELVDNKKDYENKDDLLYEKIYVLFIKGDDSAPLKRLVISCDKNSEAPLAYADWEKGNGPDDKGYPIHILELNDPAEGFIPPSEAWMLESCMTILDYLMAKMLKHLKRSKTRTLVKGGAEGVKREDISKMLGSDDLELIMLSNLAPGIDIRSLLYEISDQPLSQDHDVAFSLIKRVLDELSRKPAFAQVAIQSKDKTATETQAIQQADQSTGGYKVDKFKDWLVGFFYDWTKLKQKNYIGEKSINIKNTESGIEEQRQVMVSDDGTKNDFDGEFSADISIESFVQPNKMVKKRILKETMADLKIFEPYLREQGKQINGVRVVDELLQNSEVRDPEGFVRDADLRSIDTQILELATKGMPVDVSKLKEQYPEAIQRLMALFGDDEAMQKLEMIAPGLGGPDGPIARAAMDLEMMMKKEQEQGNSISKRSQSRTDVSLNANEMGSSQ